MESWVRTPDHWASILLSIRKESGLTRPELSALSGVGTSTIENYERKKIKEPSIYKVEQLLSCMGYELDALSSEVPLGRAEENLSITSSTIFSHHLHFLSSLILVPFFSYALNASLILVPVFFLC